MMEIPFSEQSGAVRNAYRDRAFLVLQMGASLPDVCVVCGNPAAGNVVHKRFGPPDHWWVLPPLTDFIYFVNGGNTHQWSGGPNLLWTTLPAAGLPHSTHTSGSEAPI